MRQLERQDISYHLVGHSHGGSVVWRAIRSSQRISERIGLDESVRQCYELHNLRTWTTMGTPFIWFSRRGQPSVLALASPYISIASIPIVGWAMLLGIWQLTTLSIEPNEIGVSVPSFLYTVSYFAAATCIIALLFFSGRSELARNVRAAMQAYSSHRRKWLGIWSQHDEAIQGIQVALKSGRVDPPRWTRPPRRFNSDVLLGPLALLFIPFRLFYNLIGRRLVGILVARVLRARASGSDAPNQRPARIEAHPEPSEFNSAWPSLPECLENELLARADEVTYQQLQSIRLCIADLRFGAITPDEDSGVKLQDVLDANMLVHTQYHQLDTIVDLIALHIAEAEGLPTDHLDLPPAVSKWYRQHHAPRTKPTSRV